MSGTTTPRALARAAWTRLGAVLPGKAELATVRRDPRRDLIAGVTVAIVALPLALGFGISSGLGAEAGMVTAVIVGAVAAVFGGSNLQVSGPTGAMTVVLVPIVAAHGASGVLTVGLLAGVLLIGLSLARAGRYMQYVPTPVVEGFTVGIALVIALQQVPAALGVDPPEAERVVVMALGSVAEFARHPDLASVGVAVGVAATMLVGARGRPAVPFSLVGVTVAAVVTAVTHLPVATIGELPSSLPAPSLGFVDVTTLTALLPSAVAVAALAALESLLSATVADAMSVSERHDPDKELFGQGLANLAAPMFGGVPATAAIARTAVNVRSGAVSRLAALTHALVLAAMVFLAAPLVARIPLAALAGVLLATAIRMVEVGSLRALARAGRGDAVVLVLTAIATVALDLVVAVVAGLVVAGALALRAVARSSRLNQVALHEGLPPADHHAEEQALLGEHIVAYRLDGPLFFAGAHRFLLELTDVADVRVVILRMSRVTAIDATGAIVLRDAIEKLEGRGVVVLVSGIRGAHVRALEAVGVLSRLRAQSRAFATTPEAIAYARTCLDDAGVLGPQVDDAAGGSSVCLTGPSSR